MRKRLFKCRIFLLCLLFIPAPARADPPRPDHPAVRCIIGEAAGEGFEGMTAIGEAIRNRGHLGGVYGCEAAFVDREPAWVWEKAGLAWIASRSSNLVRGATHWESTDFPVPWWAEKATLTARIGKHKFYKNVE